MQLYLPGMKKPNGVHDFSEMLQFSNINSDQLDIFYRSQFPHCVGIEKVKDVTLQKQGIDTIVILQNGKCIFFDEKIRSKDYGDILLEEYSVFEKKKPGWISGDKMTDYITYVIKPTKQVYFLPFLLLQKAWLENYHEWLEKYGRKFAQNNGYQTSNIPVPTATLFEAMYQKYDYVQAMKQTALSVTAL